MPDWLSAVLLGIIEGLTEFLPVSSTGHLLLAEHWLPRQTDLFNVVIQCGAVLAVIVIFKERVRQLLFQLRDPRTQDYLLKLIVAFVLTGVGGIILKKLKFRLPEDPAPVAWATLIGGVLIIGIERWLKGKPLSETVTWPIAVAVGLTQLLAAVFPGTSRSGVTILTALAMGLARPAAAEFSFLLGIPTLLAAGAVQIFSAIKGHTAQSESWGLVAIAFVVAAITAFGVVKWLLRFVQTHTFVAFGWYRIALGLAILIWLR